MNSIRILILAAGLSLLSLTISLADGSKLVFGDIVNVMVSGETEYSKPYQIDSDGNITMPVVDGVKISGQSTSEAAATITKALQKIMVNPQVTVIFAERGKMQVFVVGQVKKPGLVDIGIGDRLLQALAQAGYDDTADLSRISVRREEQSIDINLNQYLKGEKFDSNICLKSGDTIYVPSIVSPGTVLITGQATKVGSIVLTKNMTFRELMGIIGGPTVEADVSKITIKRTNADQPISIDYKRAMDGDPSSDVAIQDGDVIFIPELETSYYTVMGGVNRPGQYPLKGKLTLSEAIGEAGGIILREGDLRKIQLTHKPNQVTQSQTAEINLENILKNAPNNQPIIQRGDVIVVGLHKESTNILQILQSILPFGWFFKR